MDKYDFEGEPISLEEWAELFEGPERLLRQEWIHVGDGKRFWVSTVWLGLDHNFARQIASMKELYPELDDRPWIFETMAFRNEPRFSDVFAQVGESVLQVREATREEALAQHELVLVELTRE